MPRSYFVVVETPAGWCVQGGAFGSMHHHVHLPDAIDEARNHALGLHHVAARPTGVQIRRSDGSVHDDALYGEEG